MPRLVRSPFGSGIDEASQRPRALLDTTRVVGSVGQNAGQALNEQQAGHQGKTQGSTS